MRYQVVAITVVEADIERSDEAPGADFFAEKIRIDEHNPNAAQCVLDGKYGGVKNKAAVKIYCAHAELPHELSPQVMTWKICNTHMHDLICGDEFSQAFVRMTLGDVGMA